MIIKEPNANNIMHDCLALFVGINQYSKLKPLKSPFRDAASMAERFKAGSDRWNVRQLPEREDTSIQSIDLKNALKIIFPDKEETKQPHKLGLFFFSGHGVRVRCDHGYEGYLATTHFSDETPRGISLRELQEILLNSNVEQQVIWLDCCHAGEFLNFLSEEKWKQWLSSGDRFVVVSSRDDLVSYDGNGTSHSQVTKVLLQALDPTRIPMGTTITSWEIHNYIETAINADSYLTQQIPRLKYSGNRIDFLSGVKRSSSNLEEVDLTTPPEQKGIVVEEPDEPIDTVLEQSSLGFGQDFVCREREMESLNVFLDKAIKGETQVCFIAGDPGAGKSRLIEEFVRQSKLSNDNLLLVTAKCNDQTGTANSYLLFRNILEKLTSNESNIITKRNAQRLGIAISALVEIAPELIGTFIPVAGILDTLSRMKARDRELLRGLDARLKNAEKQKSEIEKSQISMQYTALLRNISNQYPLVIILDDLQWIDIASVNLLYYLVRELKSCRILFVGLYRSNDVAVGRSEELSSFQEKLKEIKRIYGDILIDLDKATRSNGQVFVDSLIDSQPNNLSSVFRQTLFERTGGHALFTSELLVFMREKGDLIEDADGRWQESSQLNWDRLPARVESVIEIRIERLAEDLREILNVACVEGQDFTTQVIAKIQEIKERDLVKKLSRELERCHQLVQESTEAKLGKTMLSRYAFSHVLFQVYLYGALPTRERRMLHEEVANALEELYDGQIETIAVQLAYHYTEARKNEKTATYLELAGARAFKFGEFTQALVFFNQALSILEVIHGKSYTSTHTQLLCWIGEVYYKRGYWSTAENYYRRGLEASKILKDKDPIIWSLLGLAWTLQRQRDTEQALPIAQEALEVARQAKNRVRECEALRIIGVIHGQNDQIKERLSYYEQSLEIASEINDVTQEMRCLNSLGHLYGSVFGDYVKSVTYRNRALETAIHYNCLYEQIMYKSNLYAGYRRLGNYEKASDCAESHLKLRDKIGDIPGRCKYYEESGILDIKHANFSKAIKNLEKSVEIADEYECVPTQVDSRAWLIIVHLLENRVEAALAVSKSLKPLLVKYKVNNQVFSEALLEAIICLRMRNIDQARSLLEHVKENAIQELRTQRWAYRYHRAFAQAGLALLSPLEFHLDYLTPAIEYFQDAVNTCSWAGILDDTLLILREMRKADPDNLLKPIEDDLVKKREIAWNNRPFSD